MITIGVSQITGYREVDNSLKIIKRHATLAHEANVDLLVFPEMSMGVFDKKNTPYLLSLEFDRFSSSIAQIAKSYKIDIITTGWEPSPNRKLPYNSVIFVSRNSDIDILYRKLHLFNSFGYKEEDYICAGNHPPQIIDYMGFKLSVSICYDLRFPELYRYQAINGTEISVICSAWYQGILKEEHLITLLRARAIENTMYVVCANLCAKNFCGRSSIFDPFGIKLADIGEQETIMYSEVYKKRLKEVREQIPSLTHRRDDIF